MVCLGPRDRYMNRPALVLRIFLPHPYIACRTIRGTGGSMVPVPATHVPATPAASACLYAKAVILMDLLP